MIPSPPASKSPADSLEVGTTSRSLVSGMLLALAEMPDDALIDVHQVALLYRCSTRHACRAANGGLIPPAIKVGRLSRWRLGTIRDHIRGGCQPLAQGVR